MQYKTPQILVATSRQGDSTLMLHALGTLAGRPLCYTVNNGSQLIDLLTTDSHARLLQQSLRLLLLDLQPEGLPGLAVLRQLRNQAQTAQLPIVMLAPDISYLDECRQLGASGYLVLPSNYEVLALRLQAHAQRFLEQCRNSGILNLLALGPNPQQGPYSGSQR